MQPEIVGSIGILVKRSTNVNALRTNEIKGIFFNYPCKGLSFEIFSEALENPNAKYRKVTTSMVQSVEKTELGFIFHTLNSCYELQIFPNTDRIQSAFLQ
jgi:hypothetical protein